MANSVTFEVKGLRQLGEALRELSDATALKVCAGATGAAARFVKETARGTVRRNSYDTGSLHDAIIAKKVPKSQLEGLTAAHWVTPRTRRTSRKRTKTKQATAFWAGLVEFGTVKMQAEPYLEPAVSRNIAAIIEIMKRKLADGIAREARKAAKL